VILFCGYTAAVFSSGKRFLAADGRQKEYAVPLFVRFVLEYAVCGQLEYSIRLFGTANSHPVPA
jgi:hypothetical protein